jgi:Zn-dependent protease
MNQLPNMMYLASIWAIPVVIAITFHEAAHGFVAHYLGDETAWRLGRVASTRCGTSIRSGRSCCLASFC